MPAPSHFAVDKPLQPTNEGHITLGSVLGLLENKEMSESKELVIAATVREATGKGANRQLRKSGLIPAVLLEKGKTTNLQLDPKFLPRAWQNGKTFTLDFNGAQKPVKIQELQLHPVKRAALHVDLMYT